MTEIRVTYSGLISFIGGILSIITGLIFTFIITRSLSPEEYGTWGLINAIILYVFMINPVISYWSTRDTARDVPSGRTSVLSSMLLSIFAISVYVLVSYFMGYYTNVSQDILLTAAIIIPAMFLNAILITINLGWKPHAISYGTLAFGISAVPLAFLFIHHYDLGVTGIIFSVLIAYIISILILFQFAKEKIKNKFNKSYLKKWLKLSWLPLYPGIATLITGFDISIFTIITGSVIGLAFWTAAVVLPSMISHTSLISRAVYPKLLEEKSRDFVNENLTHLFYFGIFLTSLVITFARPGLYALNPIYEIAVPVVVIMAIEGFLTVLTNVFMLSLAGIENVDKFQNSTFRDYMRSKLFYPQTLRLIQTITYIGILTTGLLILADLENSNQDLLVYWAIIAVLTQAPLTIGLYRLLQKNLDMKIDAFRIFKYVLISIGVFGVTYVLMNQYLTYTDNLIDFLLNTLIFLVIGISLYVVITYFADSTIRKLVTSIIKELKTR